MRAFGCVIEKSLKAIVKEKQEGKVNFFLNIFNTSNSDE